MRAFTPTEHIGQCRGCDDKFRISQEAIDEVLKSAEYGDKAEDVVGAIDFCLECVAAEIIPAEKEGLN